MPWGIIVKAIFNPSYCSSLYTAFAVLVCGGLDTALIVTKCIKIVISGIIIIIVITFIHQLGSSSDSNLNFVLTI